MDDAGFATPSYLNRGAFPVARLGRSVLPGLTISAERVTDRHSGEVEGPNVSRRSWPDLIDSIGFGSEKERLSAVP
jgi:hypothetical protein